MKLDQVFPSKYVKAGDLKGQEVAVAIADVQMEKLGDDQKMILYFQNMEKGLVCNKTNANRIAYLYGDDTDGWIGREVILAVEFVEYQGKTVEGIRVRPPVTRQPVRPAAKHVVTDHGTHQISTLQPQPKDGLEEVLGPNPPANEGVRF